MTNMENYDTTNVDRIHRPSICLCRFISGEYYVNDRE